MAVVLPSDGSLLGRILLVLSNSFFWLGDVIMTSPALLTDIVLTSLESLPIVVVVALIKQGGVNFVFSTVSPNLTNFLVLPNPTPYSESELLSSYWRLCAFLLDFFNTFSSFSIFLVSCTLINRICFLTAFLSRAEIGFLLSVFLKPTTITSVVCGIHAPMPLSQVEMLLEVNFLWNPGRRLGTRMILHFLALVRSFL
jgi:hypothetical protein